MNTISLNNLRPGHTGKITAVGGSRTARRRLLEMGIRAGMTVRMIKSAPLMDPLEISLGNGHMSIGRAEAALITVDILPAG
jgi:Fe2+ transport system protein FeoA